jgi:hypothetical protein
VLALYFFFMQYIAGKFRKCEKLPEQGMYLSRSRTGNIFPYRTVVVLRHHVYVPEFHDPSCYSVSLESLVRQSPLGLFTFHGRYLDRMTSNCSKLSSVEESSSSASTTAVTITDTTEEESPRCTNKVVRLRSAAVCRDLRFFLVKGADRFTQNRKKRFSLNNIHK